MLHDVDPLVLQALDKLREASRLLERAAERSRLVEQSAEPELDGRIIDYAFDGTRDTVDLLYNYLSDQGALDGYLRG